MKPITIRVVSGFLALGVASTVAVLDGVLLAPFALSRATSKIELHLRRSPGQVDVVIAGLGVNARAMSQKQSGGKWSVRLTDVDLGDRAFTPQQMVLPSPELLSVRLEPLGSDIQLIVKARIGRQLPTPIVSAQGESLVVSFIGLNGSELRSSELLDLRRPGRVAQAVIAPPMRPRAVAPPLGDMAVGTMMIKNRSFVKVSGPPVSLTLNNAAAKDALMSLARIGGYGFVFVDDAGVGNRIDTSSEKEYFVTMSFQNEPYDRALNSILIASGLEGRLDGNTLLVGTAVAAKSFGPQVSKVFRLNQVDVASASEYLGNLGASIAATSTSMVKSGQLDEREEGDAKVRSPIPTFAASIKPATYSSEIGPLVGLIGTADSRLNTITLVGDSKLINIAENYLRQIDLRQRQVAVKVQILDVGFKNDYDIKSTFSGRIGESYVLSDAGRAFLDLGGKGENSFKKGYEKFHSYLETSIVSASTKVLAEPTILVLEGQKSKVEAATEVATAVITQSTGEGDSRETKTIKSNAGLTLDVELSKVDDNGFITLSLTPEVSVPLPGGFVKDVPIYNIKKRRVESGQIRLRDRQTLVLTGIIEQGDIAEAQKWPVLGDLPLIGSFFRASTKIRENRELVILVTPSIVDDEVSGSYGYAYSPGTPAGRQLLNPKL